MIRAVWPRLTAALVMGVLAAVVIGLMTPQRWLFAGLVGYVVAVTAYTGPLLWFAVVADAERTRSHFAAVDPTRWEADLITLGAEVMSLAAMALLLLSGGHESEGQKSLDALLALASVAGSWLTLQTVFSVRYAKQYLLVEPGCIDFNTDVEPRFSEFLYFGFNLGMTYQVSDTNTRTPDLRRLVLCHCLISWVFGTVIIATALNLVMNLA